VQLSLGCDQLDRSRDWDLPTKMFIVTGAIVTVGAFSWYLEPFSIESIKWYLYDRGGVDGIWFWILIWIRVRLHQADSQFWVLGFATI